MIIITSSITHIKRYKVRVICCRVILWHTWMTSKKYYVVVVVYMYLKHNFLITLLFLFLRWSAFRQHMSWHCRQARWQKRWGSFVLRLRLVMQWEEKKVRNFLQNLNIPYLCQKIWFISMISDDVLVVTVVITLCWHAREGNIYIVCLFVVIAYPSI